jgi:hypothetical protein
MDYPPWVYFILQNLTGIVVFDLRKGQGENMEIFPSLSNFGKIA